MVLAGKSSATATDDFRPVQVELALAPIEAHLRKVIVVRVNPHAKALLLRLAEVQVDLKWRLAPKDLIRALNLESTLLAESLQ